MMIYEKGNVVFAFNYHQIVLFEVILFQYLRLESIMLY